MLDDPNGENPYVVILVYIGGRYVVKYVAKKAVKYYAKKYKGKIKRNYKGKLPSKKVKNKTKLNIEKVKDSYLKRKGINAHDLKKEFIGRKAKISHYDIYKDKTTGQLYIYKKGGKGTGIPTGTYI